MRALKSQCGFSLIELVITIVIMSIVVGIVGEILLQGYEVFRTEQDISLSDWNGLFVLESVTNDVHNIRSAGDISIANTNRFQFLDMSGATVNYRYNSGNSRFNRTGVRAAESVSSFSFSYLDKNGSTTSTLSAIRYVVISLTLTQENIPVSFSTTVGTRGMA